MTDPQKADEPARLYRYSELPIEVVCEFKSEQNLLVINKYWFEQFSPATQEDIKRHPRTIHIPVTVIEEPVLGDAA